MKPRSKISLIAVLLFVFLPLHIAHSGIIRSVSGRVISVSDGDTFKLETPEKTILKVRCYGYDAPERERINRRTGAVAKHGQPLGEEAYRALASKIEGKDVRIEIFDIDRYRRMIALVHLDGRIINWEMVREGYGECYREYLKNNPTLLRQCNNMEALAKKERRGIWGVDNYEKPSEFRKR